MIKSYDRITLSFSSVALSQSHTISGIRGVDGQEAIKRTVMAVVAVPNWTNAPTLTYNHILDNTAPIYSVAAIAETQPITAPVVLVYERPVYNGCVINGVLSSAAGGDGGSVTIDLFVED